MKTPLSWSNVWLILQREVRDQARDRRTLFMIFVLPILLYPLLGTSLMQVAQFIREQPTRILLLGAEQLPALPPLVVDGQFDERLFSDASRARLIQLDSAAVWPQFREMGDLAAAAREGIREGAFEAVVHFPPDFAQRLAGFQELLKQRNRQPEDEAAREALEVPGPEVYFNTAKEKSQLAFLRVSQVLERWREEIGRHNLAESNLPESAARPFEVAEHDTSDQHLREAALWAKVLPFLLVIWALTGAFYPAIDLCAGEKERGTLETLLSSPAERTEIVWGKLLTIMLFSMATAVLNLLSMGLTGTLVLRHLPQFGPPPVLAALWLTIALVPMAALFSALCLALAALARSTKEGQYYLMPLVLVTMPLVVLPMAPGVEQSLGNSLIPVTGVVLLLRSFVEGNYWQALPYIPVVAAVTLACCGLAMRWAVDQFSSEAVLFREGERLDLAAWVRHLMRDREDTPGVAAAVFCGLLILLVRFFMSLAMREPESFVDLVVLGVVTQLVVIATPALLMTVMLTRSPAQTLLLRAPRWWTAPAAVVLAVALHPLVQLLNSVVQSLYPINEEMARLLSHLVADAPNVWSLVLLLAVVPALCEEVAFRGFILSGFRHLGHKWQAIVLSSLFFGAAHAILQQSIVAFLLGLVIGYVAVQTGSLLPAVLFHLTHNALTVTAAWTWDAVQRAWPGGAVLLQHPQAGIVERLPAVFLGGLVAAVIVYRLHGLSYQRTAEESLQEAIQRQRGAKPAA